MSVAESVAGAAVTTAARPAAHRYEKAVTAGPVGSLPWTRKSLVGYGVLTGAGAVILAVAWYVTSGQRRWADQSTSVSVALLGVVLAAAAGAGLLLAGRRAIGLRRLDLLPEPAVLRLARGSEEGRPAPTTAVVGGAGLRHYHRPGCSMAADRTWAPASRAEHEREGRSACGVCRP